MLAAVAALATQTLENADRFHQLQGALIRHRTVLDSSMDGVIAIDAQGRIREFNPAAERMFGYRVREAMGRDFAALIIAPEDREMHRRGLADALQQQDWELRRRRIEMTGNPRRRPPLTGRALPDRSQGVSDTESVVYAFLRDISERRRGEEQLAYLAYHDPLTGLPNRVLVEQQLDLALARARRMNTSVALMFVDLDDFKEVNDQLGHAAGDQLLTGVAARLRGVLRDADVLARQGETSSWSSFPTSPEAPALSLSWSGPSCSVPCASRSWWARRASHRCQHRGQPVSRRCR